MAKLPSTIAALAVLLFALSACAKKETSSPPDVPIQIDFQSTAAAVAVDTVKVYVFDGLLGCNDLVRLRQTQQELPPRVKETAEVTPCQLQAGQENSVELDLKKDYTMLAVGQAGGKDILAGCSQQPAYGETVSVAITVALIDDSQKLNSTECVKLSDKCSGACK